MKEYKNSITKEEINILPILHFSGKIEVIDTTENVDNAIAELLKSKIIGFDTETRPSFKKGVSHSISLLQLSTNDSAFLFRLNKIGMLPSIFQLLNSPDVLKIGLSIKDDFLKINKQCTIESSSFIELQTYVKQFKIEDISLQKIYAIIFNQKISKSQRLSNWDTETLTEAQKHYAAIDAWACLKIWKELESNK